MRLKDKNGSAAPMVLRDSGVPGALGEQCTCRPLRFPMPRVGRLEGHPARAARAHSQASPDRAAVLRDSASIVSATARRCSRTASKLVNLLPGRTSFSQSTTFLLNRNSWVPSDLQVESLRTGSPFQLHRCGPQGLRPFRLPRLRLPARIWHYNRPKHRLDPARPGLFAVVTLVNAP